jgi:hypothetical protein
MPIVSADCDPSAETLLGNQISERPISVGPKEGRNASESRISQTACCSRKLIPGTFGDRTARSLPPLSR